MWGNVLDWLQTNSGLLVLFLVLLAGAGVFITRAYKDGKLSSALLMVLTEVVRWARGQLETVTEAEVKMVAGAVYNMVIVGTFLERLVSIETFAGLAWSLWTRYVVDQAKMQIMLTMMVGERETH